ncbi:MAG: 2-hydroxychromene-2-carboxylate isomerase, partial [Ferrovibrio sp.]
VRLIPMAPLVLVDATGGLPLAKRAQQRQDYRLFELERWRAHLGVKLNLRPKGFPTNETTAGKLVTAAREAAGNHKAMALAHAMMRGLWAEERDIANAEDLKQIIAENGLDAGKLFAAIETPELLAEYEAATQRAIAAGAFGAPFYVIAGEPFWGQDRLDFVERKLASLK